MYGITAANLRAYMEVLSLEVNGSTAMTAALPGFYGTEASPGYTFNGDNDTGLFRVSANKGGLVAGGLQYLDWSATGIETKNGVSFIGPLTGAVTGNADTATSAGKWTTARTLSFTGDSTGSGSVDGSANVATALTLATVNSNTGSFGSGTLIPVITVNGKGLITAVSTTAVSGAGVTSFNSRTGSVVPASGDYTVSQVTGAAPLASPTLTGTPVAPTASTATNTTQLATTAYVQANVTALGSTYLTQASAASTYAPLASPALTGTPTAPTAATATNTTQLATTAYTQANLANYTTTAGLASFAPAGTNANTLGYLGIPQTTRSGNHTSVLTDAGEEQFYTSTATQTIAANASVAAQIGSFMVFSADVGVTLTVAITSDTLRWPTGNLTGSRTVTGPGFLIVSKKKSTEWWVTGASNVT